MTKISVEYPNKFQREPRELEVNFSEIELVAIVNGRKYIRLLFKQVGLLGSGVLRDLMLDFQLPWGDLLINREDSLARIQVTMDYLHLIKPRVLRIESEETITIFNALTQLLSEAFPDLVTFNT